MIDYELAEEYANKTRIVDELIEAIEVFPWSDICEK